MNKYYFLLLFTFLFLSCKKNSVSSYNKNLVGQWQLNYAIGGQTGKDIVRPIVGTTSILVFTSNQTYQKLVNNQIPEQGSYELNQTKSYFTGQNDNGIKFSNSPYWLLYTIQKDSLFISPNFADAYTSVYTKVQ